MTRDEIIARLVAVFGPRMTWVKGQGLVPCGGDADKACTIIEPYSRMETIHAGCGDGPCECQPCERTEMSIRALTYGEVADALAGPSSPWIPADPDGLPPESYPRWRAQEKARRES